MRGKGRTDQTTAADTKVTFSMLSMVSHHVEVQGPSTQLVYGNQHPKIVCIDTFTAPAVDSLSRSLPALA